MNRIAALYMLVAPLCADELSTDRPDFTESTDVLGRGLLQIETGLMIGRHDLLSGPSSTISGPNALLRIGLAKGIELRLGSEGFRAESELSSGTRLFRSGVTDISAGVKLRLWEESSFRPAVSLIGALVLPTGASRFSGGSRQAMLKLCWSKSLPAGFDLASNFNAGPGAERDVTLTVGHRLSPLLGAYIEVYRLAPLDGDERAHWIANAGVTRRVTSRVQVDLETGHTVKAHTPAWFFGVGLAFQFRLTS